MAKIVEIKVAQEDIDKVQNAHIDAQAYQESIAHMIDTNRDNPGFLESAAFTAYQKQYASALRDFEAAKQEVSMKYLKPANIEGNIRWSLDYGKGIMNVEHIN